ncbi:thiamine phosphate synthase [Porphyromonas sp. COT-290 OH3588]|uniref:thiamine phosphate synthase n=1 Tax=Porphyromonas sp. COT-290 OH3588 TaxID=1515617 RepID=UPI000693D67E|nr:thiamine phosphate synthase [Porphyromonas sp. COT-290 OH3588]
MFIAITPPTATAETLRVYNQLFALGLQALHLRLLSADRSAYEAAICAIEPKYRHRLVLCDHFDLLPITGAGGIHLRTSLIDRWREFSHYGGRISASAHSIDELEHLPFTPTYALLGPAFDSISKVGYRAGLNLEDCRERLPRLPFPVIALGGITPQRAREVLQYGFSGAAALGYLSDNPRERFVEFDLPCVLSLAGHDPTSGAGLVADARAIAVERGYPLTICTALTEQHESHFASVLPLSWEQIERPLLCLLEKHRPLSAKIGLVANLEEALRLVEALQCHGVRHIIWDPILSATASSETIHPTYSHQTLSQILDAVSLITPNRPEAIRLFGSDQPETLKELSKKHQIAILLKGGHSEDVYLSCDQLHLSTGDTYIYSVPRTPHDKHGTGCTLSAVIATKLAQGYDFPMACRLGQWAVDRLRRSSTQLLGSLETNTAGFNKETRLETCHLQYITDSQDLDELLNRARAALQGGIRWIQLRMKHSTSSERLRAALALKEEMKRYASSTLIIDDDVEVALQCDAHGVHLGLNDMPIAEARKLLGSDKIIGGTCNRAEDIELRALEGADYVGVGPWRMTYTKERLAPILGETGMRNLVTRHRQLPHSMPIVGIGGIELEDFGTLAWLGLSGIALSGLINHAEDVTEQARLVVVEIDKYWGK